MAIVSSENKTCASESLLELYKSFGYRLSISVNCIIPIISLFCSFCAIQRLCSQSIIQYSTRILLISTIMFAVCHQVAYFSFKIDLLYQMLFDLDDYCNLQRTSFDCRWITIGTTTGNCGLALSQMAMSIDRFFATVFPNKYFKLKSIPGIILSFIVFFLSFSAWFLMTTNDPLTGWVNHCGFYPTYSVGNFNLLLRVTFWMTVFNFIADILLLYSQKEFQWRTNYDFVNRFESRVALKCTQAIFLISICQFVSNILYSGLTWLLMVIGSQMTSAQYSMALSIIYATPYACLVLPLLITKVLNYIREQRARGISTLRNQKQDIEEHMAQIKTAWN